MTQHYPVCPLVLAWAFSPYALLAIWGSDAWPGPGKFIYAFGDVNVTSRAESRRKRKGQILNEGDLVSAGADGSAQIPSTMRDAGSAPIQRFDRRISLSGARRAVSGAPILVTGRLALPLPAR